MIEIEQDNTNALTITFNGKQYLFMGYFDDFDSEELQKAFHDILDEHHRNILSI